MAFCRDHGIPFVTIVHSINELWWPQDEVADELAKAYRSALRVFNVSRRGQTLLEEQIGERLENCEVVWNPYNVSPADPPPWPECDGTWRLASIGLLQPAVKGQDLLFHVLARAQWADRKVELNVYGDGPCRRGLRRLAETLQLSNIHFRGSTSDIKQVWAMNHMLVLPSRYEGLPLTLVESMWCARPAVVSDVGGIAEICVDGRTAFLVPAPNVAMLEDTMERAWTQRDAWMTMGKAARARAQELIPTDPVGGFSRRLVELAESCGDSRGG
jgi:glycosyltransferase involved in cell wall biosynthesis